MRLRTVFALSALALSTQALRAQESPTTQQDLEKSALIAAKSDLRNLVTAQEAYYADHSAYASELDGLKFRTSTNVTVRLTVTKNNGWAAESRNALLPNVACVIWVNVTESERPKVGGKSLNNAEGEPACGLIDDRK